MGCVPLHNLMEDAATAEIGRTQVWQWIHHKSTLDKKDVLTVSRFNQVCRGACVLCLLAQRLLPGAVSAYVLGFAASLLMVSTRVVIYAERSIMVLVEPLSVGELVGCQDQVDSCTHAEPSK